LKVLLVEPEFPISEKSKNHKNYLPIGLLKLAKYHKNKGDLVKLARGNLQYQELDFVPDQIMITSLFTYWRKHVKESVEHYKSLFPKARIIVGGIYASLMPEDCKNYTGCDQVFEGVHKEAEKTDPYYDLVANPHNLGYQIIHASRGCVRQCRFCGVHRIEPKATFKKSVINEIHTNKLVFYDNNLLANPHIRNILEEIARFKHKGRPVYCESQCGFDGRLLTSQIATLIRKANFRNVRIAWDGPYSEFIETKKQIDMLIDAGYRSRDIFVFMIYNWEIEYGEMEKKRKKCEEWKVQIADCRYRPLDQPYDNYNPLKKQTNEEYFIHPKWTDDLIKRFRRNVRHQNICVRMGFGSYDRDKEREGMRKREVRNKVAPVLKAQGYKEAKIRQVEKIYNGWSIRFRNEEVAYRAEISHSFKVNFIVRDGNKTISQPWYSRGVA